MGRAPATTHPAAAATTLSDAAAGNDTNLSSRALPVTAANPQAAVTAATARPAKTEAAGPAVQVLVMMDAGQRTVLKAMLKQVPYFCLKSIQSP